MKRCSTCNRTYTDPNLSFCIDDGTPLTTVPAEDESTVVSPSARQTSSSNPAPPYQPPGTYVPPAAQTKKRRVWPWVVGIGGAFILGIAALAVAAAIFIPRAMRRAQNEQPRVTIGNVNQSANTNTNAPANTNTETTADTNTPPPTDHDQVLAQLTALENEWTVANFNADKKKLDKILADDYVGEDQNGQPHSKAEYLRTIQRDVQVEKWEFEDLKLLLAGDRATLNGRVTFFLRDREAEYDFKDNFVWRDGRWQATGSDVTPRQ
jgi:hypothetical protein